MQIALPPPTFIGSMPVLTVAWSQSCKNPPALLWRLRLRLRLLKRRNSMRSGTNSACWPSSSSRDISNFSMSLTPLRFFCVLHSAGIVRSPLRVPQPPKELLLELLPTLNFFNFYDELRRTPPLGGPVNGPAKFPTAGVLSRAVEASAGTGRGGGCSVRLREDGDGGQLLSGAHPWQVSAIKSASSRAGAMGFRSRRVVGDWHHARAIFLQTSSASGRRAGSASQSQ